MQPGATQRYLAVPLKAGPLLFIVVFSALGYLAVQAGPFGLPLLAILFVGFCNYAFAVMDAMAAGAREAPVITVDMLSPLGGVTSLAILVVVAVAFVGVRAAGEWTGLAGEMALGLVVLALLVMVMAAQGASGSLAQAFNPWRAGRMALVLGRDYLLLVCVAALFFVAAYAFVAMPFMPFVVTLALVMFGWLAVFALIGGVLHERREDLGLDELDEAVTVKLTPSPLDRERDAQVDRIYGQWRSGAHANAWQTVTQQLAASADPLEDLRWLHERIARWPDPRFANRIAEEWVTRLLAAGHTGQALHVIDERLRAAPDFRPRAGADLLRWAELALRGGERRIARRLLGDFPQRYPEDPLRGAAENLRRQLEV